MAKIQLKCKHCNKYFLTDWDKVVSNKTATGYLGTGQPSEQTSAQQYELTLDLKCPNCNKKASYKYTDARENNNEQ